MFLRSFTNLEVQNQELTNKIIKKLVGNKDWSQSYLPNDFILKISLKIIHIELPTFKYDEMERNLNF